jgi:transketolase
MKNLKRKIVDVAYKAKEGHIASAFSILDILDVLYTKYLKPNDKFVLSKGHASLGLYVILNKMNLITDEELNSFCEKNSILGGHPNCNKVPGVEFSTGSLGHGLPMAMGIAMAYKIKNIHGNIVCLIGDGEANEGTIWETAMLAAHHNLDNLTVIIDYNHSTDRAVDISNLRDKFTSFGWYVMTINGHNHDEILSSLNKELQDYVPKCIIANTIKGYGIPFMENNPEWHHKFPNEEEYKKIMDILCENNL